MNFVSKGYNAYRLADLAECTQPDTLESPGAKWLELVRDGVLDQWNEFKESIYPEDMVFEVADSLVPIYTNEIWEIFVDLGAYREGNDLGITDDTTKVAQVALLRIAERLINAILREESFGPPVYDNDDALADKWVTELYDKIKDFAPVWVCPWCAEAHNQISMIMHLNDTHKLSIEYIADWVEDNHEQV